MADFEDRNAYGLTVRIDRTACAAFKDCVALEPEAFELGEDGIVRFSHPDQVGRERLVEACKVCPANALHVWDESGNRIVPGR